MSEIRQLLEERGSKYGNFYDHACITQALKQIVAEHCGELEVDQVEALEMICHKMGRILNGDPNYEDSWVDIAGYATLVAYRLRKENEPAVEAGVRAGMDTMRTDTAHA
jgi:hypothetical protein